MGRVVDDLMVGFMIRNGFDVVSWNGIELTAYRKRIPPYYIGSSADGSLEPFEAQEYTDEAPIVKEWGELEDELPVDTHLIAGRSRQLKKQWRREWGYET